MIFSVVEILGRICFKILIVLSLNPYALNYCIFIAVYLVVHKGARLRARVP